MKISEMMEHFQDSTIPLKPEPVSTENIKRLVFLKCNLVNPLKK